MSIRDILSGRRINSNIAPIARMGQPVRSKATRYASIIPENDTRLGFLKGGNLVSGLTSGLKSYLGFKGARQDYENERAYNDYLAQIAEQRMADQEARDAELNRIQYLKMGINPDRLSEEGYLDSALAANAKNNANQAKGEFGYAMSVIQSPEFKDMPKEEQKLWTDFANAKAKGLDNVYSQAYQSALGAGKGKLETAQDVATAEAIGRNLLTQNPTGELTPIKGSKEDITRNEKKTKFMDAMRNNIEKSDMILGYIDQAIDILNKNPMSAGYGAVIGKVNPYSEAGKLNSLLASIKGNVGLKQLIESKAEGATYGALSEKELQMLQDIMGKIDQFQSPTVLMQVLQNVRDNYSNVRNRAFNAIYGNGQTEQNQPITATYTNMSDEELLGGL